MTPVALIVFNRPDTTAQVLDAIRAEKPARLFVIADGPRVGHITDQERCKATRRVIESVDWPCEVKTHYAEVNMGCKMRVSSGINWLFEQVDEAIILEDDCVPTRSFFRFCSEMLQNYRHDTRIMHIGGSNYQLGVRRGDDSYYFSKYPHIWGWATWKRAWQHYDVHMNRWPAFRDGSWLHDWLSDSASETYWRANFQSIFESTTTWDVQWIFACWSQGALSISPSTNLVANIGAGTDATHTTGSNWITARQAKPISFPLVHPGFPIADSRADRFTQKTIFRSSWPDRLVGRLWREWREYHDSTVSDGDTSTEIK